MWGMQCLAGWSKRGKINGELDDVREDEIERTERGERQMTVRGKG